MDLLEIQNLESSYKKCKEGSLFGRWIKFSDIENLFVKYPFETKKIGNSVNRIPINAVKIGQGSSKILIWSQMHGDESTGTKALFDLLNYFYLFYNEHITKTILSSCSIEIIPMLNPDGALKYTRFNATGIDLNRDAVAQKAIESKLLRGVLDEFQPNFCFNLHDQRTIFGVEGTKNPASVSFLSPSEEVSRKVTEGRKKTMNVIIAMNNLLQKIIPNHIGRYTDEFYPNATGDNFQKLGHNTILIEAGHFQDDYQREFVRKLNFFALLQGIYHIATANDFGEYLPYFEIPNNKKNFFDLIHRSPKTKQDLAFQYKARISKNNFELVLEKVKQGDLSDYIAHKEVVL